MKLFNRLGTGLFLCLLNHIFEEPLFLLLYNRLPSMKSFYLSDVDAADNGLDLLFDRNTVKNLLIADKRKDLGTDLGLHNRKLAAPHKLRRLVDDRLRKTGFFDLHPLFINDQHGDSLLHGINLLLLFFLFLLRLFSKEI